MTEEDNRSAANLLLVCREHAAEIDDTPNHFPADMLREWKSDQLAESRDMQRGWQIDETEAQGVIEVTLRARVVGVAGAGSAAVLGVARAVGLLIQTCRQQRRRPAELAHAWMAWREQVAWSFAAWDMDGNRLRAEPPRGQTRERHAQLVQALGDVVVVLEPLAASVVAELHAANAADGNLAPWCQWVETTVSNVIAAAGRWPADPHPLEDDDVLLNAVAELERATAALSATWRGEVAEQPPPPEPSTAESVESEQQRRMREHRELLETARPWGRSERRPYDSELCQRLFEAASFTAEFLPVLPSFRARKEITLLLAAGHPLTSG